jgi:hypothetical protein
MTIAPNPARQPQAFDGKKFREPPAPVKGGQTVIAIDFRSRFVLQCGMAARVLARSALIAQQGEAPTGGDGWSGLPTPEGSASSLTHVISAESRVFFKLTCRNESWRGRR